LKRLSIMMIILAMILCACGTNEPQVNEYKKQGTATLSAVGDIFLTEAQLADARQPDGSYRFSSQFDDVIVPLSQADLTFGNFEGNFTGSNFSAEMGSYPDELAHELSRIGFDLLQTANSYSIYNGVSGLERTKQTVEAAGMSALGTYTDPEDRNETQVIIREVGGIRFAFVAFTKGVGNLTIPEDSPCSVDLLYKDYTSDYSEINTEYITRVLEEAKERDPDVIVAGLHWGSENNEQISQTQEEIADLLIRNGVDVILGSHSHLLSKVERRFVTLENGTQKECVIAYSLGDFSAAAKDECNSSAILTLRFEQEDGTTKIADVSYLPISAVDRGEGHADRFRVVQTEAEIELFEGNYYDHISQELYDEMLSDIEKVRQAIGLD